jgi:hypothetical protein
MQTVHITQWINAMMIWFMARNVLTSQRKLVTKMLNTYAEWMVDGYHSMDQYDAIAKGMSRFSQDKSN